MKGGLPSGLTLDGKFDEAMWKGVNKNNYLSLVANGANINIVGKLMTNGILFGVTVNHTTAPNVSFNGTGNVYTYQNIEFRFENGSTGFYYTIMGKQNNKKIDKKDYIVTLEIDGNDMEQVVNALNEAYQVNDKPTAIICHTAKIFNIFHFRRRICRIGEINIENHRYLAYNFLINVNAPSTLAAS